MENKYKLYISRIRLHQDRYGFISSNEGDSLLWTSLVGCLPDFKVNINAAYRKSDNTFHRRPLRDGCCGCWTKPKVPFYKRLLTGLVSLSKNPKNYQSIILDQIFETNQSSTISRDMLMGLAYYSYYNKNSIVARKVILRALTSFGSMGYGDGFRTGIRLSLFSTYLLIYAKLTNNRLLYLLARLIYFPTNSSLKGYGAHLHVLHLLLRRDILGGKERFGGVFQAYAKRQPLNPLFQYAAGNLERAENLIMNPQWWPDDSLPTTRNRKEEWLMQRDYGDDWQPKFTGIPHTFPGGDFLFMYWLLKIKG